MQVKEALIIVEGPQGTGKTTVTNWMREKIPYANLYRLTGSRHSGLSAYEFVVRENSSLLTHLESIEGCGFHGIFDRFFFTEEVYCRLGYKEYQFTQDYFRLLRRLVYLDYNIYIIRLHCAESLLEDRLNRDKAQYQQVKYEVENRLKQSEMYEELMGEVCMNYSHVSVLDLDTTNEEEWKNQLSKLFKIYMG